MRAPRLPHPLHLIAGLLNAQGLSLRERYAALRLCTQLAFRELHLDPDISVAEWLRRRQQSLHLIEALWKPLCLASLNTIPEHASAQVFQRVLRDAFTRRREDSDLLFPRRGLGAAFPAPAADFIARRGGRILCATRVTALQIHEGHIRGVGTTRGDIAAKNVIIAIPPDACHRLISPHPELHSIAEPLARMASEPTCTIYLRYPADIHLGTEMIGLLETTGQWLFDLAHAGRAGWMAVVISGGGPHMLLDHAALQEKITIELARLMPHWPAPLEGVVIREKRATFSCRPGINALRPGAHTPVHGCWLAGDYTATGYPATLEGAVISGVRSARAVVEEL